MKKGSVLVIIGIIILSLAVVSAGTAVYFYNFHVFKTVRICFGDGHNTPISCDMTADCISLFNLSQIEESDAPDFLKEKFSEALDRAVYCDGTCFIRNVRGVNIENGEIENLEFCDEGEDEFLVDIHGKEGLEVMRYIEKKKAEGA